MKKILLIVAGLLLSINSFAGADCSDLPNKLKKCEPFKCSQTKLLFGATVTTQAEIFGLLSGKCKTVSTVSVPNQPIKKATCNYTPEMAAKLADQRIWIAEAIANGKKINQHTSVVKNKTVTTLTVDGVSKDSVDEEAQKQCEESN